MSESDPKPLETAVKEPAPAPQVTLNVAQPKPANSVNGKNLPELDDDEEYEVEYVYEDEEEEYGDEEAIEVDEEDVAPRPQVLGITDDDEEIEVEYEDEEDEEYNRIANKIDELLSQTNSLKRDTPPVLETEPVVVALAEKPVEVAPKVEPVESVAPKVEAAQLEAQKPVPQELPTASKPAPVQPELEEEEIEEVEEVEVSDDEELPPPAPLKKQSPPIARSSTVEDSAQLSPPGQLRHVHNQWSLNDLNDEESLGQKDSPDSDNEATEPISTAPNLGAIKEEEESSPIPPKRLFGQQHQTLSDAMADEEEINEIEIALEDWQGDLEEVEEVEEESDQDEVDPVMPDNLLLHANDQIAEALHEVEESELKVLAEGGPVEPMIQKATAPEPVAVAPARVLTPTPVPVLESKVPEPVIEEEEAIEMPPVYERKFSNDELEARREEAREIVINAIDAALARDLGKLMGKSSPTPSGGDAETELRRRPVSEESAEPEAEPVSRSRRQSTADQNMTHNLVASLILAAVLFILLKFMWWFNSS